MKNLINLKVKILMYGNSALMILLLIIYYLQRQKQGIQAFICR